MPEVGNVTRRTLLKRIALIGAAVSLVGVAVNFSWRITPALLDKHSNMKLLAQRDRNRPRDGKHWLTPSEYALVTAMAAVIIPSDDNGPGAKEAGVADEIDQMLARTPSSQELYASGLHAFDRLAQARHGRSLVELNYEHQAQLLALVYETSRVLQKEPSSILGKGARKITYWFYRTWHGIGEPEVALFDRLVNDITEKFYTSQVAWDWLGYDGPPFPFGYTGTETSCLTKTS